MKPRLYIFSYLAFSLLSTSCSDYLKDDSGDLLIPEKVEEFQSVLYEEGYPHTFAQDASFIDLMTDDIGVINSNPYAEGYDDINIPVGRGAYLWSFDVEYYVYDANRAYENRYKNILACNIIIENEPTMIGSANERNFCIAQAYALRAYSYFCLINWYGLPYNKSTANKDMGVAIRLSSEVTRDRFKRSTVQEVYDQINKDIERSLELFNQSNCKTSKFLMSKQAVLLLKSRIALFTENWDDVIKYGNELYNEGIKLQDIGKLTAEQMNSNSKYSFINLDNTEVIFNFGGRKYPHHKYMIAIPYDLRGPIFAPSQTEPNDLINTYEEGDNRIYAFFRQDEPRKLEPGDDPSYTMTPYFKIPIKFMSYYSKSFQQAFRTAEVLLNLSEAYIQKGGSENFDKAIDKLNELRSARFTPETYKALHATDFQTKEDLLAFARAERRRELCFDETHRWNDLRRQGMPRIVHKFRSATNAPEETYVLRQGDPNYTLALPYSEINYNTEIEVYNRRVIEAQ